MCVEIQMYFFTLQNEVHDLKHNSSGNLGSPNRMYGDSYGADSLQEPYTPVPSFQAPQLTGRFPSKPVLPVTCLIYILGV